MSLVPPTQPLVLNSSAKPPFHLHCSLAGFEKHLWVENVAGIPRFCVQQSFCLIIPEAGLFAGIVEIL